MTRRATLALLCVLVVPPLQASHTYRWAHASVQPTVEVDGRTERMSAALERVPDCIQERMSLVGAHVVVIGARPPASHPMFAQVARDFLTRGWRLLAAPFVRVQGRAYPFEQVAFVRRGARGLGRTPLFTRWLPLTGRGEQTILHEYGHLVAFSLAIAGDADFYERWAWNSPHPLADAISPRSETVKQQEWFARAFADFYESDATRARLPEDVHNYLARLEDEVHRGVHDDRFLELARLTSRNRYLTSARQTGERLLPAELAGALRDRGAWGLGFYGQLWYAVQSRAAQARFGSLVEPLEARRQQLLDEGSIERADLLHLRESCGDLGDAPLCRAVRKHRSRVETWHPCLGAPIEGCLVSYGPTTEMLDRELPPELAPFPWLETERHRELALGRLRQRPESIIE